MESKKKNAPQQQEFGIEKADVPPRNPVFAGMPPMAIVEATLDILDEQPEKLGLSEET